MKKLKNYYIKYRKNIHDEFVLCWVEENSKDERRAIAKGFERIRRQRAFDLCVQTRHKLKSPFYKGFRSSDKILPFQAVISKNYDLADYTTNNSYVYERI